ncbi:hypothetical protein JW859_11030 [bacterium]|nr:hypothetical protein [bacterium]
MGNSVLSDPAFGFWLTIYSITLSIGFIGVLVYLARQKQLRRSLTWDLHSEYIDISEFSNKNIPLRVTYKGIEPSWLWATYVRLRNTGRSDIVATDSPEKQHLIAGCEGGRYIGFNRLISDKAKVTLSPLFKGNDVYCKIEFDRLGPGDEILLSLLFIADDKQQIDIEGDLFGSNSRLVSGRRQRVFAWRSLWWLLLAMIFAGTIGGAVMLSQADYDRGMIQLHLQTLLLIYFIAIGVAAVFMRPIRFWQQIPEAFHESGSERRHDRFKRMFRFFVGLSDEF